jgi:hypothetical protein
MHVGKDPSMSKERSIPVRVIRGYFVSPITSTVGGVRNVCSTTQ